MKRRYIIIIMFLIVILLATLIIINKQLPNEEYNLKTYSRIQVNAINEQKYSIVEESIELKNNSYFYTKKISYEEKEYIIKKEGTYTSIDNKYYLDETELTIKDNELCSDFECTHPFTRYTPKQVTNNIELKDFSKNIVSIKNIEKNVKKNETTIIVIISSNQDSLEYKDTLENITKDYDIKFYTLNINKVSKKYQKEIKNKYGIENKPSTMIFKSGILLNKKDGNLNEYELHNLLTNLSIKSR